MRREMGWFKTHEVLYEKQNPIGRAKCQKQTNLKKETMEKANEITTKPKERGVSKSLLITKKSKSEKRDYSNPSGKGQKIRWRNRRERKPNNEITTIQYYK